MADYSHKAESQESCCFLTRLRRDKAGNTLVVLAAGLFPLLALVGGSVDMGRNYLAQTRLQKACDSGVLAARRKLGTQAAVDGVVPPDVAAIGNMFFNLNFRDGAFGTEDRRFEMTVQPDFSIQGQATANVPTTVMKLFGYDRIDLTVECEAS